MIYHLKFSLCAGAAGASASAPSTVPASKAGVSSALAPRFCSKSLVCSPEFNSSAMVLLSICSPLRTAPEKSLCTPETLVAGEVQEQLVDRLTKDHIYQLKVG